MGKSVLFDIVYQLSIGLLRSNRSLVETEKYETNTLDVRAVIEYEATFTNTD